MSLAGGREHTEQWRIAHIITINVINLSIKTGIFTYIVKEEHVKPLLKIIPFLKTI